MIDYRKYYSAPMLLSSQVTALTALTAVPDVGRLNTVFRAPSLVTAINFLVESQFDGGAEDTSLNDVSSGLQVQLNMGPYRLTAKPTPVNLFGSLIQSEGVEFNLSDSFDGQNRSYSNFKWVLPKPLYVPAGAALQPQFTRTADGDTQPMLVTISYSGWYLKPSAPKPNVIDIPYVAAFISNTATASVNNFISNEMDLANPFLKDLYVQNFIARARIIPADPDVHESSTVTLPSTTLAKIRHSAGWEVVPALVPWSNVFDPNRARLHIGTTLKAKEYFTVYAQGVPATYSMRVAMVGSRQERV